MDNSSPPFRIGISFGGTKIALALVDKSTNIIIAKSKRIEWRNHPLCQPTPRLSNLLHLVTQTIETLLAKTGQPISMVENIGIAWPGPGRYSEGILTATFIPDCSEEQNIHLLLIDAIKTHFGQVAAHLNDPLQHIHSGLDVIVRAFGEVNLPTGTLYTKPNLPAKSGLVLNIATGIAGAIIQERNVVLSWPTLGETYGQWGRFLFKDLKTGRWYWQPTKDGSTPDHDKNEKRRFTELCAGPAIARRFWNKFKQSELALNLDSPFLKNGERNLSAEKELLIQISNNAAQGVVWALEFVLEIGTDIGQALAVMISGLNLSTTSQQIVLAGSVGENFGKPSSPNMEDVFLQSIQKEIHPMRPLLSRTALSLDAEILGLTNESDLSDLNC